MVYEHVFMHAIYFSHDPCLRKKVWRSLFLSKREGRVRVGVDVPGTFFATWGYSRTRSIFIHHLCFFTSKSKYDHCICYSDIPDVSWFQPCGFPSPSALPTSDIRSNVEAVTPKKPHSTSSSRVIWTGRVRMQREILHSWKGIFGVPCTVFHEFTKLLC